jgi:hypothetical protein
MSQAIEGKYQHYSMGFPCQVSLHWCLSLFAGCRRSNHPLATGKSTDSSDKYVFSFDLNVDTF